MTDEISTINGMTPARLRAIERLRQMVLAALREHQAEVWLFGSCARRDARQHSDIDIAILPGSELPPALLAVLGADIEDSTIPYNVDLVDLRHAVPALIAEVRREGIPWRT